MTLVARDVVKQDISTFLSSNMESSLWQECFYQIYKHEKRRSQFQPEKKVDCISIIQEGRLFYNYLLRSIKTSDEDSVFCSYQCLVHLGDLNRYLSMELNPDKDAFKEAESYYQEAIQLNPKIGNAYHQLSILASFGYLMNVYF